MSARPSAFVERLRRELLQRPGITRLPICEGCQREVPPRAMQAGLCPRCKVERDEASDYWQAQIYATLADEPSPPAEPMFASDDAAKPFLPEDD